MITATHGSGHNYQILASRVCEFEMVMADGTLEKFEKGHKSFENLLVNFGSVGIITSMTMLLVPKFTVMKSIYQDLKWENLFANFDEIMLNCDFLSFFTTWEEEKMNSVWVGQINEDKPGSSHFFGAEHIATPNIHPVPGRDSSPCVTTGLGLWREKIYHFLPD